MAYGLLSYEYVAPECGYHFWRRLHNFADRSLELLGPTLEYDARCMRLLARVEGFEFKALFASFLYEVRHFERMRGLAERYSERSELVREYAQHIAIKAAMQATWVGIQCRSILQRALDNSLIAPGYELALCRGWYAVIVSLEDVPEGTVGALDVSPIHEYLDNPWSMFQ